MSGRLLLLVLGVVFLLGALTVADASRLRLPGDHTGYEPEQPIRFSHRLHAGELAIDCLYCHSGAERSRHAGIPSASVCMNCHKTVTALWAQVREEADLAQKEGREPRPVVSAEIEKLRQAVEKSAPISWVQVHKVPDFVTFDHRPHVAAGLACDACHGAVKTMERVQQVGSLSMGFCVNCHRGGPAALALGSTGKASTDCSVCHH